MRFIPPDAFTPNGDSKNNTFRAYGMGIQQFEIWVFNRWGENVWYADDMELTWDGTYRGSTVKDDVYVWKIIAIDVNGDEHEKHGHVTVLK
ncbi:MAG: gliding motility-associated-like protein [Arenicella sp.]|jgi:gliding motility-associated-like protein